jgi:hypothetical protein
LGLSRDALNIIALFGACLALQCVRLWPVVSARQAAPRLEAVFRGVSVAAIALGFGLSVIGFAALKGAALAHGGLLVAVGLVVYLATRSLALALLLGLISFGLAGAL